MTANVLTAPIITSSFTSPAMLSQHNNNIHASRTHNHNHTSQTSANNNNATMLAEKSSSVVNNTVSLSSSVPRVKRGHVSKACTNCRKMHAGCDKERPCSRCVFNGCESTCVDTPRKKRSSKKAKAEDTSNPFSNSHQANPNFPASASSHNHHHHHKHQKSSAAASNSLNVSANQSSEFIYMNNSTIATKIEPDYYNTNIPSSPLSSCSSSPSLWNDSPFSDESIFLSALNHSDQFPITTSDLTNATGFSSLDAASSQQIMMDPFHSSSSSSSSMMRRSASATNMSRQTLLQQSSNGNGTAIVSRSDLRALLQELSELREKNKTLENTVGSLTRDINELKDRQAEFTNILSGLLIEPITPNVPLSTLVD